MENRVLKDSVILRGSVHAEQTVPVAAGGGPDGAPIVTRLPVRPGQAVKAGQLLMEVSGRPVIALQGSLPMYRDLKPGAQGNDVAQLQESLLRLGYSANGDAKGLFGPQTKVAVSKLYEALGYEALPAQQDGGITLAKAKEEVTAARRTLEDLPKEAPSVQRTRAAEDLQKAQAQLDDIESKTGPMVLAAEIVYLGGFPGRVESVNARVGAKPAETAMTLSSGRLVVNATLLPHQKGLVQPGQPVQIHSEATGATAAGTVATVSAILQAESADTDGAGSAPAAGELGYPLMVRPTTPLPASFAGQDVRLTVEAASTKKKALVVPLSAVSAGADGKTAVTVLLPGGAQQRIPVTTGSSGDGFVEVLPVGGRQVTEGQSVIVGIRGSTRSGGADG
ncbi:peptidoglycan-binding protein [Streptomyces sp. NPDC048717]|uniref:efflux RND transporter periplasmic adaptor subunit n=1 Tax=Streptomyces sp. NPDC048717 TaxID=3154928 RepID=UPI00342099E2